MRKTTLVRAAFPARPYVSLENPGSRRFELENPRGFLGQFPDGAILDEIQCSPEMLKAQLNRDERSKLFHWRDSTGNAVAVVGDNGIQ